MAAEPVCVEEANFKRVRTVTEDSGIEEDINNEHFVTDVEFDSVIEVIVTCQYLTSNPQDRDLTPEQTRDIIDKYCADVDDDFREILNEKLEKIFEAKLNKSQLFALLEDVQDIYDEPRCKHARNDDNNEKDCLVLKKINFSWAFVGTLFTEQLSQKCITETQVAESFEWIIH